MRWRSARSATTLLWVAALVSGVLHVAQARKKHYRTLGVSEKATETEIKKAYKRLALKWHPDKNPSKEAQRQFLEVKTAYETLSDPQKRREYDFSHTRSFGASYFRRSTFESHHSFPLSGASFRQKVLLERSVWVILVYSDSDPWSSRCAASWDAAGAFAALRTVARQVQPGVDAGRVNMDEQWFLATNLLQRRALVPAIVITARGQYMDRIPLRGRRPQLISGLVLASLRRLLEGRVQYAQDAAEARAFLADSSTRFLRPSGRHLPARSAHERVRILVVASSLSEMSGVAMAAEIVHGPYAGDFDVLLWEGAGTTWRKSLGLGKRGSRDWPPCGVVPRRTVDESPNIICESRSRDVFRDFLRQNRVPALPWLTRESALRQGMPPRICGPPKRCVVIAGQYSRLYSSVAVESPALDAMEGHIMAAAAFARRYPYENPLSVDGAQYAVVLLDTDAQPKFAKAIGLVGRHGAAILSGTTLTTYKDALFNSADDIIAWIRKPLCTGCDAARHTLRSRGLRTATALLESTLASELPWWDWMAETSTDIYRRLRSDQETWKKFATFAGIAVVVLVAVALLLVDLRARNGEEEGPIDEESDDGDDADPYRDGSSGRSRDDVDPRSIIPSITVPSVTDRILTRGIITVVAVHRDAAEDAAAVLASVCSRYSRDPVVFCTADYDTTALPAHDGLMYSWRKVIERDHSGVALIAAKAWKGDVSEYIGPVRPVDIAAWLDEILSGRPFSPVGRG